MLLPTIVLDNIGGGFVYVHSVAVFAKGIPLRKGACRSLVAPLCTCMSVVCDWWGGLGVPIITLNQLREILCFESSGLAGDHRSPCSCRYTLWGLSLGSVRATAGLHSHTCTVQSTCTG